MAITYRLKCCTANLLTKSLSSKQFYQCSLLLSWWEDAFSFFWCNGYRSICIELWKHIDSIREGNQSRQILSTTDSHLSCENSRELFLLDTWIEEPVYPILISFKVNFAYVVAKRWKSEKQNKTKHYVLYPILVINAQRKFQLSKIMILPWVTVTSDDSNSFINWNINSWNVGYNYTLQMTHLFCDDNMQPKTLNTLNSSEFLLWAYTLWRCF